MTSEKENPEGPPVRRPPGVFNRMFHRPGTTPYRIVDAVVWLLILASVVLVALELFVFDRDNLLRDALTRAFPDSSRPPCLGPGTDSNRPS